MHLNYLIGEYDCKVDAKGRLMLPVAFKNQLSKVAHEGFVVKKGLYKSFLELYPMQEWNATMEQFTGLNKLDIEKDAVIRKFTIGAKFIELDATSRILIPKNLLEKAAVKKEVVVRGNMKVIEIWSKDKYVEFINEDPKETALLFQKVMGDTNKDELS